MVQLVDAELMRVDFAVLEREDFRSARYFRIWPNSCSILPIRSSRANSLSGFGVFCSFSLIASLMKVLLSPSGMRSAISW